jgi:hypothetical protein
MRGAPLGLCALALAACAEPPPLPDVCLGDAPPAAPLVTSAAIGRRDVTGPTLVLDATPPDDPDGDVLWATDYEIWTVEVDGALRERVWWATVVGSHPPPVAITDGRFEGVAAVLGDLELWRDHAVRIRHVTRTVDGCEQVGAWSPPAEFRTDDGSRPLFDPTIVREVAVTLPPASYAAIDAEARPPGCVPYERPYHVGELRYLDRDFPGVGVKVKGGCGSARRLSGKAGLKISLGWDDPAVAGCPAERRVGGLDKLTLNNMVQDDSLSHERLAYAFFRELGVPVPRTAPVRLTVNGTFFGHYLHVETVDRRFLARHFDSNQGMLYEGTYWCDLEASNIRDDDSGCLTREFSPDACDGAPPPGADPEDYTPLRALIAALDALPPGGFYPAITELLDFDAYLAMWAGEAVLSHWDGYTYNIINNYRLYHDPATDRWTFIPSGLDQTFQPSSIGIWSPSARIAQRCLQEPACEAEFAQALYRAVEVFERMRLDEAQAAIAAQLAPLLAADPGREFDAGEHAEANRDTVNFIRARAAEVRADLASRGHSDTMSQMARRASDDGG